MAGTKVLVGVAVAALFAATAPVALAHAAYKGSDPADGATVASPPVQISAEFTEPITESSSMSVFDPCGAQVDNGDSDPNGYNMTVSMSGDRAGTYTVEFKVQSVDSHVTSGSFTFTSSGGDPCPGAEPPPTKAPAGGSGGGSDGRSGGGGAAPQAPVADGSDGSTAPVAAASDDGGEARANARARGIGSSRAPSKGKGSAGGEALPDQVAFQNTGSTAPRNEPAPWDLPVGGVVLALVLCVLIGAAGGRVYAGIVAPPRR